MAGTLTLNTGYSYSNSNDTASRQKSKAIIVSGTARIAGRQTIGLVEETISMGDVTLPGIIYIENLDSTNFVTVGCVTGQRPIKIPAGEGYAFRLTGTSIFIAADTASVDVLFEVFSN